jgi:hypothetical protein
MKPVGGQWRCRALYAPASATANVSTHQAASVDQRRSSGLHANQPPISTVSIEKMIICNGRGSLITKFQPIYKPSSITNTPNARAPKRFSGGTGTNAETVITLCYCSIHPMMENFEVLSYFRKSHMLQKTGIIKPTIYFLLGIFLCLSAMAEDTKSVEVMDGCPRLTYKINESYQMFLDRIQVEHGNVTAQHRANGYESEISRIENNLKTGVMSDLKSRSLSKAEIKSCKNLVVKYKKMVQDFYRIPIVATASASNIESSGSESSGNNWAIESTKKVAAVSWHAETYVRCTGSRNKGDTYKILHLDNGRYQSVTGPTETTIKKVSDFHCN